MDIEPSPSQCVSAENGSARTQAVDQHHELRDFLRTISATLAEDAVSNPDRKAALDQLRLAVDCTDLHRQLEWAADIEAGAKGPDLRART